MKNELEKEKKNLRDVFPLGHISGLGVLGNFVLKNQTRKIDRICKDFELYQVSLYNFLCQNVTMYIYKYIYIYIYIYVCMYVCMYVYMYICILFRERINIQVIRIF